jgi:hypothetical protein
MTTMSRRDALRLLGAGAGAGWLAEHFPVARSAEEAPMIHTRPIPSSGEEIPVIGLGTYATFDVGKDASERAPLEQVLLAFVAAGGKLVDSSPMYGQSEEVVGDLAAKLELGKNRGSGRCARRCARCGRTRSTSSRSTT